MPGPPRPAHEVSSPQSSGSGFFRGWAGPEPCAEALGEGPGRRRGEEGGREGRATLLPGSRGVAQGRQGSFLRGIPSEAHVPLQPGRALAHAVRCATLGPGSRSCLRAPRAAPRRIPGGGVAQPLRLPVSGWRDPGGSYQAHRTIPLSPEKNCASVGRKRDELTRSGSGSNSLLHGLNFKK